MILAKGLIVNQTDKVINDGNVESHYDETECMGLSHELLCKCKKQYLTN